MLKLTEDTRIYVADKPVDCRKAINGLASLVIEQFEMPVNDGSVYVFYNAMFTQAGISVTRATLSNWLIKSADLLTPLVKLMEADINDYDIAYADETSLQVLKHPHKNHSCGFFWVVHLPGARWSINTTPHAGTRFQRIFLLILRVMFMPIVIKLT